MPEQGVSEDEGHSGISLNYRNKEDGLNFRPFMVNWWVKEGKAGEAITDNPPTSYL